MTNKSTDVVGSLAKGLRVFEAMAAHGGRMSITDAALETGFDRATARRCLLTLHQEGYASYDGKFFQLTPKALRLGAGMADALPLPQIVQPWLDQLTDRVGQSCSVAVLDGTEIVYVARAAQRRVMSIGLMPGSRLPAHCTSLGRVLLAAMPEGDARDLVAQMDLTPRTSHTLSHVDDIMKRIGVVRENGYALVDQEIEIGLRSIAVPLFDQRNKVVAALNLGMAAIHERPEALITAYLPALLKVQSSLKSLL